MSRKGTGRFKYASEVVEGVKKTEETAVTASPEKTDMTGQLAVTDKTEVLAQPAELHPAVLLRLDSSVDALQNPAAYALPPQQRGRRAETAQQKRTDLPREQLNVRIRPELKRAAAGLAGLRGMTLGDVVEAALIDYLTAAQKPTETP